MADFLPSRSVLSVCFPGCLLTSGEAEQLRKSKEIDKCLNRDKMYVKRLVKILLLGAGESGKSTFLKQMRIIHGQDFDQKAKEEFRATIFSNVIKGGQRCSPGVLPRSLLSSWSSGGSSSMLVADANASVCLGRQKRPCLLLFAVCFRGPVLRLIPPPSPNRPSAVDRRELPVNALSRRPTDSGGVRGVVELRTDSE